MKQQPNLSLFQKPRDKKCIATITTLEEFITDVKSGRWAKMVAKLRQLKGHHYKKAKENFPGITISGNFKSRAKSESLTERLLAHSGYICLDIDAKDNPKLRIHDLIDNECLAQFVSAGGKGIKIIYRCSPTTEAAVHRRIYDAAVERLRAQGIKLKVDPIVKSIASIQFVTHDPEAYYLPKTKLVIKPLPPIVRKKIAPTTEVSEHIKQLEQYIEALGKKDITTDYNNWLTIAFGLSFSLGENGRSCFHKLSQHYKGYSVEECDEKYDSCLEQDPAHIEQPVTIASVFQLLTANIPKNKLRPLAKKYNKTHAVGVGEDAGTEQSDLAGMVRYKLFLFKKVWDKKTNTLAELYPHGLNLNAFEKLLREVGFYRYGKMYIRIVNNIVEEVDIDDILRIVTRIIEADGDYEFSYKETIYRFSWEEIVHLWRTIRAYGTTANQIGAALEHWTPNLLNDTATISYVPYRNGVVRVTKEEIKLLPYEQLDKQIWKERILPRNFSYTAKVGMFEEFFENVCGRGDSSKQRRASEYFKRALWYFGYMLQGSKRQSTARAWLLYDIRTGNNGRSGKTIIGQAVGKIRSMVTIDGKQVDFRNRFAFQTVQPWTDVVFIDDPSKYMSIVPLFNMISGDLYADRKALNPIVKPVKFMIASNWILEAEGKSESGRQFVTQLDDFYARYSTEHKNTLTPIVDLHGKEFFTDWDENDWHKFDSFAMRALKYHLSGDAPQNTIIGNALLIRFVQVYGEELFFHLASTFIENVKLSKHKTLLVPQQLIVNVVKESDAFKGGSGLAGKTVKEFFTAIGVKEVKMTSMMVGSLSRAAYEIAEQWKQISFGDFTERLPKIKL